MLSLAEVDALERQLMASIIALNKKNVADVTLIEAVDEAMLWPQSFDNLAPIASSLNLESLITRAPLFICAVAAEIGFRFEGVGTVFWAKFSDALGITITMAHRQRIADVFEVQATRYNLSRPSKSPFSSHFSIIAWPISNALLPIDLVGPVTRLIARAPIMALAGPGRSVNFPSLRAWASAAEGARLADWLRFEAPATRVLTALLTENRGSVLSHASYTRLRDAVSTDPEAFFAARAARMRTAKSSIAAEQALGRLSLLLDATGIRLFANWPALSPSLYDEARGIARSAGWRPQIWGVGGFLHPDTALSAGPFAIATQTMLTDQDPAYPDVADVFGAGNDIAVTLSRRTIDWADSLLFDVNEERTHAEQRFDVPRSTSGYIWLGTRSRGGMLDKLKKLGAAVGYHFFEANLGDPGDRAILTREGHLSTQNRAQLARHPVDAIGAPQGVVRPDRPFLLYKEGTDADPDARPQCLPADGRLAGVSGPTGAPGLKAEAPSPSEDSVADLVLFERDSAFEALTERRLQLRIGSRLLLVNVAVSVDLEIGGRLVARGQEFLSELPITVPTNSKLLAPLYEDSVRTRVLETGKGLLRIAIGRSHAIEIELERPFASVDWEDGSPRLVGADLQATLVEASAQAPHRFTEATAISIPTRGAKAYGLLLSDDRIADPVQLFTSHIFDYGDFTANFTDDIGSRRMFDRGRGVGDIARARIAWARALCTTLSAIGAKGRIVRQFEAPLVVDLCGRAWSFAEQASSDCLNDPHQALWQCALESGLATVPSEANADQVAVFANAFVKHAQILDPDWPIANSPPVDGAMDDALNNAFSEAVNILHAEGALLDVEDDFDFGAPFEDWEAAAKKALHTIRRTTLVRQIAPSQGGRLLSGRNYANVSIAELAEDLAGWTKSFALPRGQLSAEVAAGALHLWLSPSACDDVDAAVRVLSNDPFVSRATRYVALRVRPGISAVTQ